MKTTISFSLLSACLLIASGCGFKSDLYLSDITPPPDITTTELPPLPTLDEAENQSIEPVGVVVEIPARDENGKKKSNN